MIIVAVFFALLALGVPIFAIVLICAGSSVALYSSTSLLVIIQQLFNGLDSSTLLAVPFFIVAGSIASKGRTSQYLIKCMSVVFGRLAGGSVIATVAACAFFAAISGSSMATVVAVGSIMIPALKEEGYPETLGVGTVCSGGTLGIMIPPSAPMVMFCVAMQTSIGKQFMAGFVPGLLTAFVWAVYIFVICRKNRWGKAVRYSRGEAALIFVKSIPALLFPAIVLGSIYLGWATPTESAAISVVYVLIIEMFLYRTLRPHALVKYFFDGLVTASTLLIIIGSACALSYVITTRQIPNMMVELISSFVSSKEMLILVLMILLFVAGCFVDTIALIVILAPILVPLLTAYKVDLIHFGIMAVLASQIGYLSPPFGTNLFITMQVANKPFAFVVKSVLPFMFILIAVTLVICFIPAISLWLPSMMHV